MMLHVIYRSYGGENQKGWPDYYSKRLALLSFVRSLQELKPGQAEPIFLNDGPIPDDRLRVMENSGEVMARSKLGARGSMWIALKMPIVRAWPHDDLVWFAEDDYLYQPRALTDLIAAADAYRDASYFALYATIGSRMPNGDRSDERLPSKLPNPEIKRVNGHSWDRALSTTSTFGARVKPLIEDQMLMRLAVASRGGWDHTTCLMYQGYIPYPMATLTNWFSTKPKSWAYRATIVGARIGLNCFQAVRTLRRPVRKLVGPDPALITHMETPYVALGTDWRSVAESTQQWASALPVQRGAGRAI
jgi:hypothetical protein